MKSVMVARRLERCHRDTAYSRLRRAKLALREKLAALSPAGQALDPDQTALATRKVLLG